MDIRFHLIICLFIVACAASIRIGWILAIDHYEKRLTKEMRQEAAEYFQKQFFDEFVARFEEKVEARAIEIATQMVEELEKENSENEGSGSC